MSDHDDVVDAFAYAVLSTKPKQPSTLQRFMYWLVGKTAKLTKFILRKVWL